MTYNRNKNYIVYRKILIIFNLNVWLILEKFVFSYCKILLIKYSNKNILIDILFNYLIKKNFLIFKYIFFKFFNLNFLIILFYNVIVYYVLININYKNYKI